MMLKIMGNRLGKPEDNRFFQVCVGADPSGLGDSGSPAPSTADLIFELTRVFGTGDTRQNARHFTAPPRARPLNRAGSPAHWQPGSGRGGRGGIASAADNPRIISAWSVQRTSRTARVG